MRVFAISDIHVDFDDNLEWVKQLSASEYSEDALIVAGDICDKTDRFKEVISLLRNRFRAVFFVPGNHDLWLRGNTYADSLEKFWGLIEICKAHDIRTNPVKLNPSSGNGAVWIVPLYSWYVKPEEGTDSLFLEKPGEDPSLRMWSDNYLIKWPEGRHNGDLSRYFLELNTRHLKTGFSSPVITFSHFLPRQDLIFSLSWPVDRALLKKLDRVPAFNFSRVAGSGNLDKQLRHFGSLIHVFGHQHRNRNRLVDGVHYISHCLGYPKERKRPDGEKRILPKLIWDENGAVIDDHWY